MEAASRFSFRPEDSEGSVAEAEVAGVGVGVVGVEVVAAEASADSEAAVDSAAAVAGRAGDPKWRLGAMMKLEELVSQLELAYGD